MHVMLQDCTVDETYPNVSLPTENYHMSACNNIAIQISKHLV